MFELRYVRQYVMHGAVAGTVLGASMGTTALSSLCESASLTTKSVVGARECEITVLYAAAAIGGLVGGVTGLIYGVAQEILR